MAGKKLTVLAALMLVSAAVFGKIMSASSGFAAEEGHVLAPALEALGLDRMLTPEETKDVAGFVDKILVEERDLSVLRELSEKIKRKAEKDKNGLMYLLINLERLARDPYARRKGEIKAADLRVCRELAEELDQEIKDAADPFSAGARDPHVEYYLHEIETFGNFLIPEKADATIPELWEAIQQTVKPGYRDWNKAYVLLRSRLPAGKESYESLDNIYTFEEMEFIRKFGDVQARLRRFSRPDSHDF